MYHPEVPDYGQLKKSEGNSRELESRTESRSRKKRWKQFFLYFFIALLFVVGTIFHIDQYTKVLRISNEIHRLEKRLNTVKEKRKILELKKSDLCRYEMIYDSARKLGMSYPSRSHVYWLQTPGNLEKD